ncbi:conserved hypothetical protein [Alkaliphilus metalliredigens QYMF]|uniref:Probable membrane transporter protein n=1 Tax=Alkaliphilus metalliredigens (strain QYMF) TaxID=293826 RepID=A6TQC1_ALKMQ|nr:sulfite exporter TauE/SafE family protein [Alkaliphilus metalliredigens]ABR48389.1 conserved hypothetical protein [Alkaliphilus metalliredigens QYMF]
MILFLLGLLTGAVGGMGIGGGTILIPGLIFLTELKQQSIQGVNLLMFIPVAVIAVFIHYRNGNVLLNFTIPLVSFGIFGTIIGSKIALVLPSDTLRKLFGIFLLIMGVYEFLYKGKQKSGES